MAKKATPVITHVEIVCHAIRNIENEIRNQQRYLDGIPECGDALRAYVDERIHKLKALKEMYRIETGTDYV